MLRSVPADTKDSHMCYLLATQVGFTFYCSENSGGWGFQLHFETNQIATTKNSNFAGCSWSDAWFYSVQVLAQQ
jgi:hypothetical protein